MDEKPETAERPENEPTPREDGASTERGEGPRDQPADTEQLHAVPTDHERDEER